MKQSRNLKQTHKNTEIFDKVTKAIQWKKKNIFNKWYYLEPYTKINFEMDHRLKHKTTKPPGKKYRRAPQHWNQQ